MSAPAGCVFVEAISPQLSVSSSLVDQHVRTVSEFQTIDVCTLEPWGTALVLDGHMQSASRDEFMYHESLVHPAVAQLLLARKEKEEQQQQQPMLKKVFVGGGGEGATCREVLRFPSVERLVMVDIDGRCVDACRDFLKSHHQGSFDDPRCEVVIDDAKAWLERTDEIFDVIILDLADPLEEGPCIALYTEKFYEMCRSKLSPNGVLVTQSGPAGALTHHYCFTAVHNTLKGVFPSVQAHSVFVPSFVDHWGFSVASKAEGFNLFDHTAEEIDSVMREAMGAEAYAALKCYDGEFHLAQSRFPKNIRQALADEKRVISEENLVAIP